MNFGKGETGLYARTAIRLGKRILLSACILTALSPAVFPGPPIVEYPSRNLLSQSFTVYGPARYYLPYDPSSRAPEDRNNAVARNSISAQAVLVSRSIPFISPCSLFAAAEMFLLKGPSGGISHADNFEYGIGWSLNEKLFWRITHSEYAFHDEYRDSGRLYWTGLSLYMGPFQLSQSPARIKAESELYFFPPHNEYDPNPGVPFENRITARYAMDARLTFRLNSFPRTSFFARAFLCMGDTRPQNDYNYKADPISLYWETGMESPGWNGFRARILYASEHDVGGLSEEHRPLDYSAATLQWRF